jgi:hypothetical protein
MGHTHWNLGQQPNPPQSPAYYGVGEYGDAPRQVPGRRDRRLNPMAPAAVVAGLLALALGVVFTVPWGLVALALGAVAIVQVSRSEQRQTGVGLALSGAALGLAQVALWAL